MPDIEFQVGDIVEFEPSRYQEKWATTNGYQLHKSYKIIEVRNRYTEKEVQESGVSNYPVAVLAGTKGAAWIGNLRRKEVSLNKCRIQNLK